MRTCKGKVMLSINDHPDIRRVFAGDGLYMADLKIRYAVACNHGSPAESGELVITNWDTNAGSGLF